MSTNSTQMTALQAFLKREREYSLYYTFVSTSPVFRFSRDEIFLLGVRQNSEISVNLNRLDTFYWDA